MSDPTDIVERLVASHPLAYESKPGESYNRCPICEEWSPCDVRKAADEIVKLREDRDRLRQTANGLAGCVTIRNAHVEDRDAEIVQLRKALTDEGFKFCREQTVCTGCDNAADCEYAQEASDE
jgi:hypothetical protein